MNWKAMNHVYIVLCFSNVIMHIIREDGDKKADFCFFRSEVVPEKVFSDKHPDDCAVLISHIASDDGLRTTI